MPCFKCGAARSCEHREVEQLEIGGIDKGARAKRGPYAGKKADAETPE